MQNQRKNFKNAVKAFALALGIYLVAYVLNSASGGYWLTPDRDGHVCFKQELGGLSMTVAIMWQPRFGHHALGKLDYFGFFFEPLILLDRAWIHPTHYLVDDGFDDWLSS